MAIVDLENIKGKFEAGDSPGRQDYIDMIDTLAATPDISGKQDIVSGVASQSGNSGKYLTTDGNITSWATVSGGSSAEYDSDQNILTNQIFG